MLWKTKSDVAHPVAVTITETAPCQKRLRLHVGREMIAPVQAAVMTEFQKAAALPGFRKGKAPAALVERQYASSIRDEVLQRVTQQVLEQAAQEHQLHPVSPFEVQATTFNDTDGLTFEATVEVEPSFALGAYKGITVSRQSIEVTPDDVDRALKALQESMAQLVPSSGSGEQKEKRLPALDDELAKDHGFENLERLRQHVEAKLREQKRAAQAQALEASLCDELVRRHAFELPPRFVSHQTERLTRDFKVRLLLSGMPEEQLDSEAAKFTEQLRTSAERNVKLTFILDRIAAAESITVTEDELVKRMWELAQRWKKDPAEVRKLFDARGLWPSVAGTLRREKTIAWLLSVASMTGGSAA